MNSVLLWIIDVRCID